MFTIDYDRMNSTDYMELSVLQRLKEDLEVENPGIEPYLTATDVVATRCVYTYLTNRIESITNG